MDAASITVSNPNFTPAGTDGASAMGSAPALRPKAERMQPDEIRVISNYGLSETQVIDGRTKKPKTKVVREPLSISEIINDISELTGGWPRRLENMLFVDDPKYDLGFFDRRTTAALFGWLRRQTAVEWSGGGDFVSGTELFAELERTATRYEAIELLPHEPLIGNIYYKGEVPEPGDGSCLHNLLDRFRPETTIDRDLIQAAIMTTIWGGPPGKRPMFVISSDAGRGSGKSTVAQIISSIAGGHIDVSCNESIDVLKARMLTPSARTKRIAMLDNVKTMRFSWAELEAMITSPIISGKQMYFGEAQRPNLLTWLVTLNGISLSPDIAQRAVIIKILAGAKSGHWWDDTMNFIADNRQRIIGDVISALRAEPFPLKEFSRWDKWDGEILSRLPEPNEAAKVILERQGEANVEIDEAEIIEDYFFEQLAALGYTPDEEQIRIPVSVAGDWWGAATGEGKRLSATRKLKQMKAEGTIKRLAPDPSHSYGRCVIWTGANADFFNLILNDLPERLGEAALAHAVVNLIAARTVQDSVRTPLGRFAKRSHR